MPRARRTKQGASQAPPLARGRGPVGLTCLCAAQLGDRVRYAQPLRERDATGHAKPGGMHAGASNGVRERLGSYGDQVSCPLLPRPAFRAISMVKRFTDRPQWNFSRLTEAKQPHGRIRKCSTKLIRLRHEFAKKNIVSQSKEVSISYCYYDAVSTDDPVRLPSGDLSMHMNHRLWQLLNRFNGMKGRSPSHICAHCSTAVVDGSVLYRFAFPGQVFKGFDQFSNYNNDPNNGIYKYSREGIEMSISALQQIGCGWEITVSLGSTYVTWGLHVGLFIALCGSTH